MKQYHAGVSLSGKPVNTSTVKADIGFGECGSSYVEHAVTNIDKVDFPSLSEQKEHSISEQAARQEDQKKITVAKQHAEDCEGDGDDEAKCGYVVSQRD